MVLDERGTRSVVILSLKHRSAAVRSFARRVYRSLRCRLLCNTYNTSIEYCSAALCAVTTVPTADVDADMSVTHSPSCFFHDNAAGRRPSTLMARLSCHKPSISTCCAVVTSRWSRDNVARRSLAAFRADQTMVETSHSAVVID